MTPREAAVSLNLIYEGPEDILGNDIISKCERIVEKCEIIAKKIKSRQNKLKVAK